MFRLPEPLKQVLFERNQLGAGVAYRPGYAGHTAAGTRRAALAPCDARGLLRLPRLEQAMTCNPGRRVGEREAGGGIITMRHRDGKRVRIAGDEVGLPGGTRD